MSNYNSAAATGSGGMGTLRYEYERNISSILRPCPGFYCGRMQFDNGTWSTCGPCPRGFHRKPSMNSFACLPCDRDLQLYDWLYLGFMAILPVLLHLNSIDEKRLKSNKETVTLVICAIVEVAIAAIITLLVWEPFGSFRIVSCGVSRLSDWYPIFYNPQPNYEETLHCSHEVVYPLYTIVLIFYALADLLMLVLRSVVRLCGIKVAKSIYAGLYFYPLLALGHLVFAGLIYEIFPFSTVMGSIISIAYHFSKRANQNVKSLFLESVKDWRNVGIILCHWFLHAYGIISITKLTDVHRDLCFLVIVPAPVILYILTVNFTDPSKIRD